MRIKLIVNPVAGQKKVKRYISKIKEILGLDNWLNLEITEGRRHSFHLARKAAEEKHDIVVACGGDGTAHEVVNGVISSGVSIPVGFIPFGASNAYALSLGIPANPTEACQIILRKKIRSIDLGKTCNQFVSHYFLSMAGIGFDAEATYLVKPLLKEIFGGVPAHILAGAYGLVRFDRTKLFVEIDGSPHVGYQMLIFNGKFYGAGLKAASNADMTDGYLDVYLFKQGRKRDFLRYVMGVVGGHYSRFKDVEYFRTKKIKIDASRKTWVQLDGEVVGTLPQEFEICSQAIKVITA